MVSTPPYSLSRLHPETAADTGLGGRTYMSRTGDEVKKLSIAQVQFMGKPAFLLMTFSNYMVGKNIFVPECGF